MSRNLRVPRCSDPGIFDVVGTATVVIDPRVERIDLATELADRSDIWPLSEANPPPVFLDDPGQDPPHDVVLASEILVSRFGEPQVSLTELLKPDLKIVKPVATGEV